MERVFISSLSSSYSSWKCTNCDEFGDILLQKTLICNFHEIQFKQKIYDKDHLQTFDPFQSSGLLRNYQ